MTCDCQRDEVCELQRRRLAVCTPDVLAAMGDVHDTSTPIGCSLAELVCSADTSCLTALDFYRHHCRKLFQGLQCTQRCNNSLAILHQVEKARKLRTCTCDGTEGYNCQALMTHTERLCFPSARYSHHHHNQHHLQRHQQAVSAGLKSSSSMQSAAQRKSSNAVDSVHSNNKSPAHHVTAPQYHDASAAVASGNRQSSSNQHHHQSRSQNHQRHQQQKQTSSQNVEVPSLCVYPMSLSSDATSSRLTATWTVNSSMLMILLALVHRTLVTFIFTS